MELLPLKDCTGHRGASAAEVGRQFGIERSCPTVPCRGRCVSPENMEAPHVKVHNNVD